MRDIITKLEQLNVEKEQLNEGLGDMAHEAEKDHEVQMARSDCYKSAKYAVSIHKMLKDVSEMEGIDGWVASKLTKAADYLGSVKHYMEGQIMSDVELAVVPVAGDMTDAMDIPQESIEKVHESIEVNEASKEELIDATIEQIKKDLARGDDTALEMMLMALDPRDLEAFASEADFDDMMDDVEEAVISEDREVMVRATNIEYDGPALDKLPTDKNVKVMVPAGADDEDVYELVAEKIEDQHGVKVSGFDMKMMEGDSLKTFPIDPGRTIDRDSLKNLKTFPIDRAPGRTIDDMTPAERDSLKKFVKNTPQNTSKPAQDFYKKMGYDKLAKEDTVEEEDVIGDIIASLSKTKERMPMPKSKPAVPAQTKQKMANKMALPKSKPDMSMGQDKTTGDPRGILRQSKFSEWSKK